MDEKIFENDFFTLTDEDGNEYEFELIGYFEKDGQQYCAMAPVKEDGTPEPEEIEYTLLKLVVENGEEMLVTIDDDDELDDVADYFDDLLMQEIDYDNN